MVVLIDAQSVGDGDWRPSREDGRTRIAFLLGVIPIALVAVEGDVKLTLLHLRLLKAEEVGVQLPEGVTETLAVAGPQPVDIP